MYKYTTKNIGILIVKREIKSNQKNFNLLDHFQDMWRHHSAIEVDCKALMLHVGKILNTDAFKA